MSLMTGDEIAILNIYDMLNASGQRDLNEYCRYLLTKQYRREVLAAVFHNKLLNNLLHNLLFVVEKNEFDIEYVNKRIKQVKELYYGVFEQIHNRYSNIIDDLDSNETVRAFGHNSFNTLEHAIKTDDINLIRREIVSFYQEYSKIAKKKDARKIAAV